jgi:hypothetical protein
MALPLLVPEHEGVGYTPWELRKPGRGGGCHLAAEACAALRQ